REVYSLNDPEYDRDAKARARHAAAAASSPHPGGGDKMSNIVLVHGAWHGGWCWRDVARELRAQGHVVATPTHTGVGERAHQSSEAITLETHIRDVIGCIEAEELDDIVLCGHSYGGMVITGVAD